MFNSMNKRSNHNKNYNCDINNESWNRRQPGILASPKSKRKCNNKPYIEEKLSECETQSTSTLTSSTSKSRINRKRKFNMISSPNDYNTLIIDNDQHRVKRLKSLSLSPSKGSQRRKFKNNNHSNPFSSSNLNTSIFSSFNEEIEEEQQINNNKNKIDLFSLNALNSINSPNPNFNDNTKETILNQMNDTDDDMIFTSFEQDQTPFRDNYRMTHFRKQRVLNPIDFSGESNKSKHRKKHKKNKNKNKNKNKDKNKDKDKPRHKKKKRKIISNLNSNDSVISKSSHSQSASQSFSSQSQSQSTQSIPSSSSRHRNSNQLKSRTKKILKQDDINNEIDNDDPLFLYNDDDDMINVDPRRLSLDEHPLIMKRLNPLNQSLYSQYNEDSQCEDSPINPRRQSQQLTSLLDCILKDERKLQINHQQIGNHNNDNNIDHDGDDECDYFDDDLDDNALLMALEGIDAQKRKTKTRKRLSFDNQHQNHNNHNQGSIPSTPRSKRSRSTSYHEDHNNDEYQNNEPAIDFSPNSKRKVNSPLSQREISQSHSQSQRHGMSRSDSISHNTNMGSLDIITQQNDTNDIIINEQDANDRYYRFKVVEIFNNEDQRSKTLKCNNIKQCNNNYDSNEEQDIDIKMDDEEEWTIEIRQDWNQSLINEDDIIHIIGETVETMKKLYFEQENNNNFPYHMVPYDNNPVIIEDETHIIIDNLHNYLVIHPDCLMIPTRIAGSFPCPRTQILRQNLNFSEEKDVLLYGTMSHELFQQTWQRGGYNKYNINKDIQEIVSKHLLQIYAINENEQMATDRLMDFVPNIITFFDKYTNTNPNSNHYNRDNVVDWSQYKKRLTITNLVDIEEMVWSPMFGIRGNIDATLQIKLTAPHQHQHTMSTNEFLYKLLPFELKTGKESDTSKLRARAQLAMYSLMLADRYDTSTEGGLLFYLKTGNLMGIPLPHNEIRALLIRRNFLAKYFNSHPKIDNNDDNKPKIEFMEEEDKENKMDSDNTDFSVKVHVNDRKKVKNKNRRKQKEFPPLLPKHQKRTCINCFSKQDCFIYHKIHCYNNNKRDISDHDITSNEIYGQLTQHLNKQDIEYLSKWTELIDLEETYCLGSRHEIWALNSKQREIKNGKCLANMIISEHQIDGFKHIYTFKKHPDYYYKHNKHDKDTIKVWDLRFKLNESVTISSEDGKYGLATGRLIELNTKYVKFASYRPIKDVTQIIFQQNNHYSQMTTQQRSDIKMYRLDVNDYAYGYDKLRANIFYYFYAKEQPQKHKNKHKKQNQEPENPELMEIIERKRKLLVNEITPVFKNIMHNQLQIPSHLQNAYNSLNIDQQNATKHVMSCNDYSLILGMPGTGKSSTIIFLLRLLVSIGYKIMLSAYTNSSIDHLCLKLLKYNDVKDKFVRIGSSLSINSKLSNYVIDSNTESKFDKCESIEKYLNNKNIFAVTSTSSTSHCLLTSSKQKIFDYCIIDEAGQLTEAQVLGPLRKCRKFVLVGDNNQLPPLVQCPEADKKGMSISLFERLAKKHKEIAVKALTIQYRMNSDIMLLSNSLIYHGKMKCANHKIASQKIKLNKLWGNTALPSWIQHTINPDNNVILLNTDKLFNDIEEEDNHKKGRNVNEEEAQMIQMIVNNLFKFGIYSSQIGVMTPYRSQLKLIKSKLDKLNVPMSPSQHQTDQEEDDEDDNNRKRQSSLLLDTIDRFQGSDREIIIFGLVHNKYDKKVGHILHDWRRMNVALTRAKCKMILIASISALKRSKCSVLENIVNISDKQNWIYHIDSY